MGDFNAITGSGFMNSIDRMLSDILAKNDLLNTNTIFIDTKNNLDGARKGEHCKCL